MTRKPLEYVTHNPSDRNGIQWIALGVEPKKALETIIDRLTTERYSPLLSDKQFSLESPKLTSSIIEDDPLIFSIKQADNEYGYIDMRYKGFTADNTTPEYKTAQEFWVRFNIYSTLNDTKRIDRNKSNQERDYFLKNQ